jgi:ribosome-associated protein
LADDKKAEDVQVITVADRLKVADYFVIATGLNRNHVRAIYNELHVELKAQDEQHRPVEGADLGWWIVMDYGDVIVHLLQSEAREFYDLEHLYEDAEQLDWRTVETSTAS